MSGILDKIIAIQQEEMVTTALPTELLGRLLKELRERERDVLCRRFGLLGASQQTQTLKEIGDAFGVTRERVRQIEATAIRKLRELQNQGDFREHIERVTLALRRLLESRGGVMEHGHFVTSGIESTVDTTQTSASHDDLRTALAFFLTHLLTDVFEPLPPHDGLKPGWKLPIADHEACLRSITHAKAVLEEQRMPMEFADLVAIVSERANTPADHCEAHLHLSNELKPNAFGQWGLIAWPEVTPRRINDKIYLVLKRAAQPLHFSDIATHINEAKFDGKQAHPATVHNELIFDDRYVLVGRGTYALKEWGYEPGVVADVIASVLETAAQPLHRDSIIEAVMRQRMVRKSTILLALTDRNRFTRRPDGMYTTATPAGAS